MFHLSSVCYVPSSESNARHQTTFRFLLALPVKHGTDVLAYNMTRVVNIMGVEPLVAVMRA